MPPVSSRNLVGYSAVFDAVALHLIRAPVWQFRRDRYFRGARIPSLLLNPTDIILSVSGIAVFRPLASGLIRNQPIEVVDNNELNLTLLGFEI